MPRFVVLAHDHPLLHWDLMLEGDGVLRTWRLALPPQAGTVIAATPLGEHRLAYLDYEGPVSGDRGTVTRWDCGSFAVVEDTPGRVVVKLWGQRCCGSATLTRIDAERWSLTVDG
jgi:hypothetical protein